MIFVVIGQSGAGKTTFVKGKFLSGELRIVDDVVPYTTNGKICAIGKYGIGRRTEGTDTLPYNSDAKIRELIKKLHSDGENVLIEGDRINNSTMRFSDIADGVNDFFGGFRWRIAEGFNKTNQAKVARFYSTTMAEFIRNNWNNIYSDTSPAKAYGGILIPCDVDENGDVVYRYNEKMRR